MMAIGAQAQAQCGTDAYTVKPGDTVFTIAQAKYGDPEKWTLIYYANEAALQASVFQVTPGDVLDIPCEPGSQQADATPLRVETGAELKLLTGSNYEPFTDLAWPGEGMLTEIVNAAMETTPDPVTYSITWENDWSKHLFPGLDSKQFDMGFPWYKPPCDQMPDNERCANFHFSDPLVEVLLMLFVRSDEGFKFDSDDDLLGKSICRPHGFLTFDLDRPGRDWLQNGKVQLVRANNEAECFDKLLAGEVDAVSLNVFLGAQVIKEQGLQGRVVAMERPLSTAGMHVIISKKHWRGTTFLYRFNAGLAKLKESDRYAEIVNKHLGVFWEQIKSN
ncbi:transporter substrate-binding domain-containing protein [Tropicibacter naphthalenivorans]|uniref:LysM domain/BON superfamily protein n=2 Tax=Tropicibacter naphthalenivorans TaxID=441103 RepID=A0A0P1G2M7_9RHOB|nr:transporter substrate-binding domain-containing protein [Tropicibacter naphthalenivorans]CUH76063.1 LysM domain/BON superfamily protein [Tropicibacter naphthalenivorans]SMC40250.1 amino acid ABC transporter substrate-binding protein, PAAT family [Tropicibacter naphthalenivorans]